jgi:uncharacterized membrane protein
MPPTAEQTDSAASASAAASAATAATGAANAATGAANAATKAASSLYDQGYINAMSHFYRGELGRIMIWRQRLDITTTWAITSTTTIFTIAFSVRDVPHIIFFFNAIIVWIMLWIEARRYRFYDAFRARVRMLEAHFLVPMVLQNKFMLEGEWKKLVCEDLLVPSFKIGRFEAIGRRMKRNYIFIFGVIMTAWVVKIIMHAPKDAPIGSLTDVYHLMAVGRLPAWLVASIFSVTFLTSAGITIYVANRSSGEINEFGNHRALWKI